NELHEQREAVIVAKPGTTPFLGHSSPTFSQGFSGKGTIGNGPIHAGEPGLAHQFLQVGLLREIGSQRTRTPRARAEERFDARWNGLDHGSGGSLGAGEYFPQAAKSFLNAFQ